MKQDLNGVRTPEDVVRRYELEDISKIPLIIKNEEAITLEVSKKVGEDEVVSKINISPEDIKIISDRIDIQGTIQAINNDTTTTIDGDKITTGTITANQIATGTITANELATNSVTTDKIEAGSISASKVSSDIITTTNFSAQEINADKITSGTLSAGSIHMKNVSLSPSVSTIGGWALGTNSLYSTAANVNSYLYTNGNVIFGGNYGLLNFNNNPVRITTASKLLISDSYSESSMATNNDTISVRAFSGTIHLNSNYGVYAGSNRLDSSSSKAIKCNIKAMSNSFKKMLYDEVKKIPLYLYDYKENYGDKNEFGFIIEDLENTNLKEILKFKQNENNKDIKYYSHENLSKMNLVLIKELIDKIEQLEKKVEELKKKVEK